MARDIHQRRRNTPPKSTEWWIGVRTMPAYVSDPAGAYKPEVVLCMESLGGLILACEASNPSEVQSGLLATYRRLWDEVRSGKLVRPRTVNTDSPELADWLRSDSPNGLEIVCRPLPELDGVMQRMGEYLKDHPPSQSATYSSWQVSAPIARAYFAAAARFYRAKPWLKIPADVPVEITIEDLSVRAGAITVIGHMQEEYGYLFFQSASDYDAYLELAMAVGRGRRPRRVPRHMAMNFEPIGQVSAAQRKEQMQSGWEIASPNAFPQLFLIDEELVTAPPEDRDLELATAIADALTKWVLEDPARFDASQAVSSEVEVDSLGAKRRVQLRLPELNFDGSDDTDDDWNFVPSDTPPMKTLTQTEKNQRKAVRRARKNAR